MGLQTSGPISINDLHLEAGGSSGTMAGMNDSDIRDMIDKASGATASLSEYYGASSEVNPVFGVWSYFGAGRHIETRQLGGSGGTRAMDMNSNSKFGSEFSGPFTSSVRLYMPTMIDCRPGSGYSGQEYKLTITFNYNPSGVLTSGTANSGKFRYGYTTSTDGTPLTGFWKAGDNGGPNPGIIDTYAGSNYANVTKLRFGTLPSDGYAQMYISADCGYDNSYQGWKGIAMELQAAQWELNI